jgi:lysine 2,3-aminomutase
MRRKNKDRIINILTWKIDTGEVRSQKYHFPKNISWDEKVTLVTKWWDDHVFHLRFAVRSPEMLNEFLGNTLAGETMNVLYKAKRRGIPFFVNPYYLSLLNVNAPEFARDADLAIRYYIFTASSWLMSLDILWRGKKKIL